MRRLIYKKRGGIVVLEFIHNVKVKNHLLRSLLTITKNYCNLSSLEKKSLYSEFLNSREDILVKVEKIENTNESKQAEADFIKKLTDEEIDTLSNLSLEKNQIIAKIVTLDIELMSYRDEVLTEKSKVA